MRVAKKLSSKLCGYCQTVKKAEEFRKLPNQKIKNGWVDDKNVKRRSHCFICERHQANIKYKKNPYPQMFFEARKRASKTNAPFNITQDYLKSLMPKDMLCPALGIKMTHNKGYKKGGGGSNSSPSLDRLKPEKGYVRGNLIIVSNLANKIKQNASLEDIEKTLNFYKKILKK